MIHIELADKEYWELGSILTEKSYQIAGPPGQEKIGSELSETELEQLEVLDSILKKLDEAKKSN